MTSLKAGPHAILLSSLLFFVVSAAWRIHLPGLYYDEALFVNGALGGVNDDFIHQRLWGVPFMLFPYIGALKAYIYYPIFHGFGVSPESIRWPVVAISMVTLLVWFRLGRLLLNQWWAALLVALMATDSSFIYTTRLDWGPVVLMNLLKSAALLWLFTVLARSGGAGTIPAAWLLTGAVILGLFDKLNFIWVVIGLGIATLVVYHRRVRLICRSCGRQLLAPGAALLVLFSLILGFLVLPVLRTNPEAAVGGWENWGQRLQTILGLYRATVSGEAVYGFIFNEPLAVPSWINTLSAGLAGVAVVVLGVQGVRRRGAEAGTSTGNDRSAALGENLAAVYLFFAILFVSIFLQMAWTRQTGGAHHVMVLFPLYHVLNVLGASLVLRAVRPRRSLAIPAGMAMALAFAGILGSQVRVVQRYSEALRDDGRFSDRWSPAIDDLSLFLRDHEAEAEAVISADWGIHTQLFALSRPEMRRKYLDRWPSFTAATGKEEEVRALLEDTLRDKPGFLIVHAPGAEVFEGTRDNALRLVRQLRRDVRLRTTIANGSHTLVEVYSFSASPRPNP